jgi:hypothetical protein
MINTLGQKDQLTS